MEFLSTSKLPIHVLQQIWTMAMMIISDDQQEQPQLQQQNNNNNNTFLDRNRFYVVVRLIQLFQNEKKPIDSSLNVGSEGKEGDDDTTMRLPFFEGVAVSEVVMHAQQDDDQGEEGQMQGMTKVQHINNEGGIIPHCTDSKQSVMIQQDQQQQHHLERPQGMMTHQNMGKMHILHSLRVSHQKLQAEVVSLRATVTTVSNEEVETQMEVSHLTNDIGNLTMELNKLKQSIEDVKLKFDENMKKSAAILKVQLEKNAAFDEANNSAMVQQQQTGAKEEEVSVVALPVDIPQSTNTADLLSCDAPVTVQETETMSSLQSDAPSPLIQHDSSSVAQESTQFPTPTPWNSSDTDVSSVSPSSTVAISEDERNGVSVSPSPVDLNPDASSLDFGAPMGEMPLQQSTVRGGIPEPMGFDYQKAPQAALTPPSSVEESFNSYCNEDIDMCSSGYKTKKHEKAMDAEQMLYRKNSDGSVEQRDCVSTTSFTTSDIMRNSPDAVVEDGTVSKANNEQTSSLGQLFIANMKLHGREDEMKLLQEKLLELKSGLDENDDIKHNKKKRPPEVILISGVSGVGKSALVDKGLRDPSKEMGITFIAGKFDLNQTTKIPMSAFCDALTSLTSSIMNMGGNDKGTILDEISDTFSEEDVIMMTRALPGSKPLFPLCKLDKNDTDNHNLTGKDAMARLQYAIRRLLRIICTHSKGVIIFLDDLQWADTATLDLFQSISLDSEIPSLLLVGSYRQDEVPE